MKKFVERIRDLLKENEPERGFKKSSPAEGDEPDPVKITVEAAREQGLEALRGGALEADSKSVSEFLAGLGLETEADGIAESIVSEFSRELDAEDEQSEDVQKALNEFGEELEVVGLGVVEAIQTIRFLKTEYGNQIKELNEIVEEQKTQLSDLKTEQGDSGKTIETLKTDVKALGDLPEKPRNVVTEKIEPISQDKIRDRRDKRRYLNRGKLENKLAHADISAFEQGGRLTDDAKDYLRSIDSERFNFD